MLQSAKLSLYTPFEVSKDNQDITFAKALLMLNEATDAALTLLQSSKLVDAVQQESDLLLFFDSLMTDYIYSDLKMDADQFRAVIFKYSL